MNFYRLGWWQLNHNEIIEDGDRCFFDKKHSALCQGDPEDGYLLQLGALAVGRSTSSLIGCAGWLVFRKMDDATIKFFKLIPMVDHAQMDISQYGIPRKIPMDKHYSQPLPLP